MLTLASNPHRVQCPRCWPGCRFSVLFKLSNIGTEPAPSSGQQEQKGQRKTMRCFNRLSLVPLWIPAVWAAPAAGGQKTECLSAVQRDVSALSPPTGLNMTAYWVQLPLEGPFNPASVSQIGPPVPRSTRSSRLWADVQKCNRCPLWKYQDGAPEEPRGGTRRSEEALRAHVHLQDTSFQSFSRWADRISDSISLFPPSVSPAGRRTRAALCASLQALHFPGFISRAAGDQSLVNAAS